MNDILNQAPAKSPVLFHGAMGELFDALSAQLASRGVQLTGCPNLADLVAACVAAPGVVLVLDLESLPGSDGARELVDYIERSVGSRPVFLCLTPDRGITVRLASLRAGSAACLVKPVVIDELADRVAALCGVGQARPHRVLVLDDSGIECKITADMLRKAGIEAREVTDPLRVLEAMEAFHPDLVITDLMMPGAGGAEITAIIREHEDFYLTPVLLVTGIGDPKEHRSALMAGGDDLLEKPYTADELVDRVRRRIQRMESIRRRLASAGNRDEVSGLLTRGHMLEEVEGLLAQPSAHARGNGMLVIEIDHGPALAEGLGRGGAEVIVAQTGCLLRRSCGPSDIAARSGPFSFAVFARRDESEGLSRLAERVCKQVHSHVIEHADKRVLPSVSIGVAEVSPGREDVIALVSAAEQACARARESGGNRVQIFRDSAGARAEDPDEAALAARIGDALEHDGFLLLFQPIVGVQDSGSERYEALLRLHGADGAFIPPQTVLDVAGRAGLSARVDRQVLEQIFATLHSYQGERGKLEILVHQSLQTVRPRDWVYWLHGEIKGGCLAGARLAMVFQQAEVLAQLPIAEARFGVLRKLGVRVCIAGFDDQQASLSLLEKLPIDLVRLAFPIVNQEVNRGRFIRATQRAHDQGIRVIAGGIEEAEAIGRVWDCGADMIQGHFIQPPQGQLNFDFAGTASG